ncbi:MAG: universal stress protein [Chloroflexi bacterium]|nr:universal stress protein [Chloroflexota bacterium]
MYESILVALDGSTLAERVLPAVEPLADKFSSTLTLLRAVDSPLEIAALTTINAPVGVPAPVAAIDPEQLIEAELETADEYLERIAAPLRARGLTVRLETPQEHAAAAILEAANRLGVGLIAMTTHGRGGLTRMVFGSTADSVLRHAPCPVLMVLVHDRQRR